jgi:dCTP deaminase
MLLSFPEDSFPLFPVILSDRDIRKAIEEERIKIQTDQPDLSTPLDVTTFMHIHASSMDMRLGNTFKLYEHSKFAVLDPKQPESFAGNMRTITVPEGESFIVQPGEFVLGVTQETLTLPNDLVARVEGRSSLGRLGIIVHSTAGFVDPGFSGTITLEISNLNRLPVALYPGMRVCQLAFEIMTSEADMPYNMKPNSKYQGQVLPEESRLSVDPEFAAMK